VTTGGRFREWFWRPPRAHGDVVRDRVVSPIELVVGHLAPAPPLLVLALGAILTVTWLVAVRTYIQADAWPPQELESLEDGSE
jgi:hypothetical protein